jgi:hypothetical protein
MPNQIIAIKRKFIARRRGIDIVVVVVVYPKHLLFMFGSALILLENKCKAMDAYGISFSK